MADRLTPEQRSWNMSRIRGKNTKPELLVRSLLHAKGYRYRLHGKAGKGRLPGSPDLVFAGRRKVIFVNGCFWHFHDCRVGQHAPKANADFWEAKRTRTRDRDADQRRTAGGRRLGGAHRVGVRAEGRLRPRSPAGAVPRRQRMPGKPRMQNAAGT